MKKIFDFVLFVCLAIPSFSQTGAEWMQIWERSTLDSVMNLKYIHPKGYIGSSEWFQIVDSDYESPIYTAFGAGGISTRLFTEDGHFMVFLQFINDEHVQTTAINLVSKFWGRSKRNDFPNYIRYYSSKEAKEKFNADTVLQIEMPPLMHDGYVNHKYPYCTVKMIQKTGRGYVAMFCFYDDEEEKNLDKHLLAMEGAFRYGEVPPLKTKLEQEQLVTIAVHPAQKKSDRGINTNANAGTDNKISFLKDTDSGSASLTGAWLQCLIVDNEIRLVPGNMKVFRDDGTFSIYMSNTGREWTHGTIDNLTSDSYIEKVANQTGSVFAGEGVPIKYAIEKMGEKIVLKAQYYMDKDARGNEVNKWIPEYYVKIPNTEAEKIINKSKDR